MLTVELLAIVSKPLLHEGFSVHASGTSDDRQLRKINGRYAKKLTTILVLKYLVHTLMHMNGNIFQKMSGKITSTHGLVHLIEL